LVVPTYEESDHVERLLDELVRLLDPVLGASFEILVVDDDSPDRSWERALRVASREPRVRVVRRRGERGLSSAVVRGWQAARGDVLGVIDGDLQHPPETLFALWRAIEGGADLAVASRNVDGGGVSDWALHRRALSRGAQALGLALLPGVVGRVSDPMSGYFLVRRAAIEGVALSPRGYKILVEVLARGRASVLAEVPYVFRERAEGKSKVTWKVYVDYVRHLGRLRVDGWRALVGRGRS
jgi:dolichol-phosphate mannosyltransferase